jgi:hypothetical protein
VDTGYGYGPLLYPGTIANSFIAPAQNTRPISLGAWIESDTNPARTNISFQIWGSTPNGSPDANQILARTSSFTTTATASTYIAVPLLPGAPPLTPGTTYWFVATTLDQLQPANAGSGRFARHNQNSDGLVDDGVSMFSNDATAIAFVPNGAGAWAEVAFTVTFGP